MRLAALDVTDTLIYIYILVVLQYLCVKWFLCILYISTRPQQMKYCVIFGICSIKMLNDNYQMNVKTVI